MVRRLPILEIKSIREISIFLSICLVTLIYFFVPLSITPVWQEQQKRRGLEMKWTASPDWSFYADPASNSGPISFNPTLTFSNLTIDGNYVIVTNGRLNVTVWPILKLFSPLGTKMVVTGIEPRTITYTTDASSTVKVGTGTEMGTPWGIPGTTWSYNSSSGVIDIWADVAKTVVISWIPPTQGGSNIVTDIQVPEESFNPDEEEERFPSVTSPLVRLGILLVLACLIYRFWTRRH